MQPMEPMQPMQPMEPMEPVQPQPQPVQPTPPAGHSPTVTAQRLNPKGFHLALLVVVICAWVMALLGFLLHSGVGYRMVRRISSPS